MNARIIPITDDEVTAITSILECMTKGVDDEEGNFMSVIKLNNEEIKSFISLAKKICNVK